MAKKSKQKVYIAIDNKTKKIYTFDNWDDCKNLVNGRNFSYKSFSPEDIAGMEEFKNKQLSTIDSSKLDTNEEDKLYAYVDGSRRTDEHNNCIGYSYGCCIVKNNEIVAEFKEAFDDEYNDMFQIMGELKGALRAVEYAIENKYTHMYLIYDYEGIEKFANGSWKGKTKPMQDYHWQMQKYMKNIYIQFVKVKSHVKLNKTDVNYFNDYADKLANEAFELSEDLERDDKND